MSQTEASTTETEQRASPENPKTNLADPALWFIDAMGGGSTDAGVQVSEQTALTLTAVWRCVGVIASTIASLPLNVYQRLDDGGRQVAIEHAADELLHDAPNPDMTALVFRETMLAFALLWGNGYAGIEVDGRGDPVALWPIHTRDVQVGRWNGRKLYKVSTGGQPADFWPDELILHIPGLGFDGLAGLPFIQVLRQAAGLGIAAERFGAKFFGNGAPPGTVLEVPNGVSDKALKNLKSSWDAAHQGVGNAHKTAVLEEGIKANRYGITPNDAQFLDTRKFQATEIARLFGVPPHLIGDLERATFSNIEQQALDFHKYGLRRWLVAFEQECKKKLIKRDDRRRYYVEHNVEGLLRGDIESRYRAYATGRQWGFLNANQICDRENMNRLPGDQGDIYLVPANMLAATAVPTTPQPKKDDPDADAAAKQLRERWVDAVDRLARRERQALEGASDDAKIAERFADHADYVEWVFAPICHDMSIPPGPIAQRYVAERSKDWRRPADVHAIVSQLLETP